MISIVICAYLCYDIIMFRRKGGESPDGEQRPQITVASVRNERDKKLMDIMSGHKFMAERMGTSRSLGVIDDATWVRGIARLLVLDRQAVFGAVVGATRRLQDSHLLSEGDRNYLSSLGDRHNASMFGIVPDELIAAKHFDTSDGGRKMAIEIVLLLSLDHRVREYPNEILPRFQGDKHPPQGYTQKYLGAMSFTLQQATSGVVMDFNRALLAPDERVHHEGVAAGASVPAIAEAIQTPALYMAMVNELRAAPTPTANFMIYYPS
jgi:hypothetical protein